LFGTSVMFVMSSGNPALARIDDAIPFIYKHKIATIHPCGNPNTDLNNLTGFFKYRWKATYTDLTPEEVQKWLAYFNITDSKIVIIRVFESPHQPLLAIAPARKFQNYLDGQLLVDVNCVVQFNDGIVIQMKKEELEKALQGPGSDT